MNRFIDISFPIDEKIAIYPNNPIYEIERVTDVDSGDNATVSRITMGTHTGTHIDAPAHFIQGGKTLDQIPLERMNGEAVVINFCGSVDDYPTDITCEMLMQYDIHRDDIVILKTHNTDVWKGDRIIDDYVTLTYDAASYLVDIGVKMVGIDYLTIERPRHKREEGKSIHKTLLGNDVLICEGLSLASVLEGRYEFLCLPINVSGVDGLSVRCVMRKGEVSYV